VISRSPTVTVNRSAASWSAAMDTRVPPSAAAHSNVPPSSAPTAPSTADSILVVAAGGQNPLAALRLASKRPLFVHGEATTASPRTRGLAQHDV